MNWITTGDLWLFREINMHWVNPVFDWLMPIIANLHLMFWPFAVLVLGLLIWGGFKGRVFVALAVLCVALGDPLVINTIKHAVERPRPHQALENVRRVTWKDMQPKVEMVSFDGGAHRSMPSAHSANNTAIAVAALLVYGWRVGWVLLWPLMMMLSRVYTADHFPTDTLVGFLLGLAYTLLICCIVDRVWQKYGRRLAPKLYDKHPALLKTGHSR